LLHHQVGHVIIADGAHPERSIVNEDIKCTKTLMRGFYGYSTGALVGDVEMATD
jgi:hypothetical protein